MSVSVSVSVGRVGQGDAAGSADVRAGQLGIVFHDPTWGHVVTWVLGEHGDQRWHRSVAVELAVAAGVVAGLLHLTRATRVTVHGDITRLTDLTTVLALCAVAAGATVVILCRVYARLHETPRRSVWLRLSLSVYTVIAIPTATLGATTRWDEAAVGNIRLFAHTTFVALIFLVAFAPATPRWCTGLFGLLGWSAIAAVLVGWGETYPTRCLAITTSPTARWTLTVFWLLGPLLVLGAGVRDRSQPLSRVGTSLEIVAVAHALRVTQGAPAAPLDLNFALVRLLGLLVLVITTAAMTQHRLAEVHDSLAQQRQRLVDAHRRLRELRTRDHQLRTGLASLAGGTQFAHREAASSSLQAAITAELSRLNAMLGTTPATALSSGSATAGPYRVDDIVRDHVALHRAQGMDIGLDITGALWATGSPDPLTQVLTNLLANCARHAPGSPVHVEARDHEQTIRIRITDSGPGIPDNLRDTLFQPGSRGPHSEGQGTGLHLCQRLLHQEGGALYHDRNHPHHSGCALVIELPRGVARAPAASAHELSAGVDPDRPDQQ